MDQILAEIKAEREKQDLRWGPKVDDTRSLQDWCAILVYEMSPLPWGNPQGARKALVKVSAVAVAAIESLDRRK